MVSLIIFPNTEGWNNTNFTQILWENEKHEKTHSVITIFTLPINFKRTLQEKYKPTFTLGLEVKILGELL